VLDKYLNILKSIANPKPCRVLTLCTYSSTIDPFSEQFSFTHTRIEQRKG